MLDVLDQAPADDSAENSQKVLDVADRLLSHYCTRSLRHYLNNVVIA